jgi:hypothetical protein
MVKKFHWTIWTQFLYNLNFQKFGSALYSRILRKLILRHIIFQSGSYLGRLYSGVYYIRESIILKDSKYLWAPEILWLIFVGTLFTGACYICNYVIFGGGGTNCVGPLYRRCLTFVGMLYSGHIIFVATLYSMAHYIHGNVKFGENYVSVQVTLGRPLCFWARHNGRHIVFEGSL